MEIKDIIERFNLEPLDMEGGMFRRTYESSDTINSKSVSDRYENNTEKPFSTAILFLVTEKSFSRLHLLPTDEVYHFYLGDPIEMFWIYPDGSSKTVTLGQDIMSGMEIQAVAPRGVWQGSKLKAGGKFALVGTTMSPGFTIDDYTDGEYEELVKLFPQYSEKIAELTEPPQYESF